MSNKEIVMEAVRELPEEVTFEEILEQIAILAAIRHGEEAANAGQLIAHDELKKRVALWLGNETALLSEAALAEDWNRPEEDKAWAHLQPAK